jgi:tetratricopeptide (TPR) repeat protein
LAVPAALAHPPASAAPKHTTARADLPTVALAHAGCSATIGSRNAGLPAIVRRKWALPSSILERSTSRTLIANGSNSGSKWRISLAPSVSAAMDRHHACEIIRSMKLFLRVIAFAALFLSVAPVFSQGAPGGQRPQQPEFIRQGNALMRQGKLDDALALYQKVLASDPNSLPANNAAGVVLDLMGKGTEARKYFQKAIEVAPNDQSKAMAERSMAMSYAFEGDCAKTGEYEQKVFDYYVAAKDFYQQGEIADEAARVCIDTGDLDAASKWYRIGHDAGLQEPDISEARKDLWEFRWEHAQARLAARRGNFAEADKAVAAAKAALDKGTNPQQKVFFPYLVGYVAFYRGDYKTALEQFQKSNLNDPFIQCMIAQTYEKLGDTDKAQEFYKKAASATAHNPPGAYARRMTRTMKLSSVGGGE